MRSKIAIGICVIILGLICCHKENTNDYKSSGNILGPDVRMCACCGGWYIQIDTVIYEFDSLPVESKIDLVNAAFPLSVKLDWQFADKAACPDKRITIQRINQE